MPHLEDGQNPICLPGPSRGLEETSFGQTRCLHQRNTAPSAHLGITAGRSAARSRPCSMTVLGRGGAEGVTPPGIGSSPPSLPNTREPLDLAVCPTQGWAPKGQHAPRASSLCWRLKHKPGFGPWEVPSWGRDTCVALGPQRGISLA